MMLIFQLCRHAAKLAFLFLFDLFGPFIELGIAFRAFQYLALSQPECVGRDILQEASVVADQQDDAIETFEATLQCFDHGHIEMVGRFVQQQDIRLARECFGKGRAALLSSRQGGWVCRAIDAEFHQLRFGHVAGL